MGRRYKAGRALGNHDSIRSKPRIPPVPKEFDHRDSRIGAINSYEDVADDVDEFHLQRDKVMLDDGVDGKGRLRSRGDNNEEEEEEEAVFALSGDDSDEGEDEDDNLEDYESDDAEVEDEDEEEALSEQENLRRSKGALSDDEDDQDDEDGVEGWGTSTSAYYGGDEIATEQDALDEEAEARRIQKKQLSEMAAEDFLPDLEHWATTGGAITDGASTTTKKKMGAVVTTETLPTEIPADLSPEARLMLLRTRNPEFEPLSAEFVDLQRLYPVLKKAAEETQNKIGKVNGNGKGEQGEVAMVRFKALAAYLGVLAMYFAILSKEGAGGGSGVKEHGVMEALMKCRVMWEKVKDVKCAWFVDVDMLDGEDVEEEGGGEVEEEMTPPPQPAKAQKVSISTTAQHPAVDVKPRKRAKLDLSTAAVNTPAQFKEATTDHKKLARLAATESSLAALSSLIPTTTASTTSTRKPTKPTPITATSDFSDPTTLSIHDSSEKHTRQKTLRFHAAQLLSKSALRSQAGRHASGDTDLPRKDRSLQNKPSRKNLTNDDGSDLDDADFNPSDLAASKSVNSPTTTNEDPDLAYYNSIASKKKSKSDPALKPRIDVDADAEGKRAIGYTIEKNKGLTPHRKKEVRNPRVKKRMKYEQARKKLKTVRKEWKPLKGSYGGEETGIKKNLVKSVKLK